MSGEYMQIKGKTFAIAFVDPENQSAESSFFIAVDHVLRFDDFQCSLSHGVFFSTFKYHRGRCTKYVRYLSLFRHLFSDATDPFNGDIFSWVVDLKQRFEL